ncbi:unnamed protein product [Sphagnum balticum]
MESMLFKKYASMSTTTTTTVTESNRSSQSREQTPKETRYQTPSTPPSPTASSPRHRTSLSSMSDLQSQLSNIPSTPNIYESKTIKERYHIDVYGPILTDPFLIRQFESFTDTRYDKRRNGGSGSEGAGPLIREKLRDTYLLVGAPVLLRCRIDGNPPPRCFWYHNERLIVGDDDRYTFAQTEDGVTTLSISRARVSDIGVYRCAARNPHGVVVTNARLSVGDTPDRPSRPIAAQSTADQVYLVWDAPAFNGNSDILCYKVDYKTSDAVKWANAAYTIQECCVVRGLQASTTYRFRVSCINSVGVSAYSWASEEVTTASTPGKLIIDHTLVEALLETQYNLEKRAQQLVLVKKQSEDEIIGKRPDNEVFKMHKGQNPADLYSVDTKLMTRGGEMGFTLAEATDTTHGSKRLLKLAKRVNEAEVAILRGLKEQERLVQLAEVFEFGGAFTYVYAHAVPVLDFLSFKHKYSEECVVKVLRQLLDAVQWLHLHGFVHLNVHPLSVLNAGLTYVNVKLGGFDNAVQLDASSGKADTKRVLEIMPVEFAGKI